MENNQKIGMGAGIAIIAVVGLIVVGLIWWNSSSQPAANQTTTPLASKTIQTTTSQSANITSKSQTYKNDKFGFQIQYPTDLKIDESKPSEIMLLAKDQSAILTDQNLSFSIDVEKTNYKNIDDWFLAFKKDFEKPSNYEGITIHPKVSSIQSINIDNVPAKKYVLGGFPFSDTCTSVVKNNFAYTICYTDGVKKADYDSAKTGVDEYGQNKYDEKKIAEAQANYRKILDNIVASFKFNKVQSH